MVEGRGVDCLDMAAGGHRVQRVPPTEKRGRVHTSTVTVAIIDPVVNKPSLDLTDSAFRVEWFNKGNGGQNQNKHANCARVIHKPSGEMRVAVGKNRQRNYENAKNVLIKQLSSSRDALVDMKTATTRKNQVGSGMRGDKTVTIRFQDDMVKHHISGKSMSAKKFMKGYMELLW